ncbi:Alpha-ketoglutarate-dependent dioxygenase alkB homolog 3 (Alkylated DNA repair protein alkB homolog 3) (mAbh3) [Durusdinium trenchii]|uniref:Alpha-ketoglutarate-dependent dioxygenase alkB homolog 3 (Alkylated DNA repair protein alkB homolog 3) (MAbh3) n=1 Tax=Durusdinium trenchii TaxID=1381693 RepID=A0ABP0MW73_9DINO
MGPGGVNDESSAARQLIMRRRSDVAAGDLGTNQPVDLPAAPWISASDLCVSPANRCAGRPARDLCTVMGEVTMRWQRKAFTFRDETFQVEHFDVAEAESSSSGDDEESLQARLQRRKREAQLQRCEAELGACLWIDTNRAALRLLEEWRSSYRGLRTLELGAGAGACGIALAYDGATSTVSDVEALLPLLQRNLELNELHTAEATGVVPQEVEGIVPTSKRKSKEKTGSSRRRNKPTRSTMKGSCQAVAVEWEKEALHPTLPEKAFDLIVVCDCLYENRDSWAALQLLLERLPAEASGEPSGEPAVLLASAALRKPFLEAFVAQLAKAGFTLLQKQEGGHLGEVCTAILQPPKKIRTDASSELAVEDICFVFRHFAHEEERGLRLSPLELKALLEALHGPSPEGFAERLFQAWAPNGFLTEGRFKAGFKVYAVQHESWVQQWWLATSGGTSDQAPSETLVQEVRKDHETASFEEFQSFANTLAEDFVPPPTSFLQAVWKAAMERGQSSTLQPISDAAYDALLHAYSSQWRLWLEDWISERQVVMELPTEQAARCVPAGHRAQRPVVWRVAQRSVSPVPPWTLFLQRLANSVATRITGRQRTCPDFVPRSGNKNICRKLRPVPPRIFGLDALKKAEILMRKEFRMPWNQKRFKQLQKWERARYNEVYACPCCRERFRVAPTTGGLEIAKVVDEGMTPGVAALTGPQAALRVGIRGRMFVGSAARKLPHPHEVAALHNQVARNVAQGAAICALPPGSARPALAGRLLLEAAVSGSSTGAPLLLLADDAELEAVKLWLAATAPKYQVFKASPRQRNQAFAKVSGRELAAILMATPVTFEQLPLETGQLDYVLMTCSAGQIPMLRECQDDAPFTITSRRPRVVCLLDATSEVHQALQSHLEAVQEAKGHMFKALNHLEAAQFDGQEGQAQVRLEDFRRHVSRFPAVVRLEAEEVPEAPELPLGFTGRPRLICCASSECGAGTIAAQRAASSQPVKLERSSSRREVKKSQRQLTLFATSLPGEGAKKSTTPSGTRKVQRKDATSGNKANKENEKPKKGTKRPMLPSFLFQEHAQSEPSVPSHVEVFMTAGRDGRGGSVTRAVTVEQLEALVPVSFIPQLLPPTFADHILRSFMQEAKNWHSSKRWLYEREIESHRIESGFRFDHMGITSTRWETSGFGDDLRHLRAQVTTAVQQARAKLRQMWRTGERPLTKEDLAQETVALASRGQRLASESIEWLVRYASSYAKSWRWEPNFCVANLYRDQEDFLGAHSDPVETIGPWAIIASVTFGAARQFRMKPVGTVQTNAEGGGRITSFSIRLPHNSALICWEGFQEFWRHEVPKDKGLKVHSISGAARLNFTFRKSVGAVAARKPLCHCGRKADLKPVLKASRNRGRYFWSCRNPRVKKGTYRTCDFFQWDDELVGGPTGKVPKAAAPNPAQSRLVSAGAPSEGPQVLNSQVRSA